MSSSEAPKGWNIALWIVQVLLTAAFGMAGLMKATAPMPELVANMVWPEAVPEPLVRFIGVAEFLAAVGLVLPAATRILPRLTVLAAIGLATVQVLAFAFHLTRAEYYALPINLILGGLSAFVAFGRMRKAPIAPR